MPIIHTSRPLMGRFSWITETPMRVIEDGTAYVWESQSMAQCPDCDRLLLWSDSEQAFWCSNPNHDALAPQDVYLEHNQIGMRDSGLLIVATYATEDDQ